MSEKFTARNDLTVECRKDGSLVAAPITARWKTRFEPDVAHAVREFVLHEAGIWVDPETGALVVRIPGSDDDDGRAITILFAGESTTHWETTTTTEAVRRGIKARYFNANPEPAPKPWHDAKPGEVWVITTENVADEVAVNITPSGRFQYNDGMLFTQSELPIVSARRIWPEANHDA